MRLVTSVTTAFGETRPIQNVMENTEHSVLRDLRTYIPVSMEITESAPRRVICESLGDSTVSNPFGGVEEEW